MRLIRIEDLPQRSGDVEPVRAGVVELVQLDKTLRRRACPARDDGGWVPRGEIAHDGPCLLGQLRLRRILDDGGERAVVVEEEGEPLPAHHTLHIVKVLERARQLLERGAVAVGEVTRRDHRGGVERWGVIFAQPCQT